MGVGNRGVSGLLLVGKTTRANYVAHWKNTPRGEGVPLRPNVGSAGQVVDARDSIIPSQINA